MKLNSVASRPIEIFLLDLAHVIFWAGEKAQNEFPVAVDALKRRIMYLTQVAIWVGHNAENVFAETIDPLIHRFLDCLPIRILGLQIGVMK
jgi:hypothetical protein